MNLRVFFLLISFALFGFILNSCATNSNVHSNRIIQKRKYNKGFFFKQHQFLKNRNNLLERSVNLDSLNEQPSRKDYTKKITLRDLIPLAHKNNKIEEIRNLATRSYTKFIENHAVNYELTYSPIDKLESTAENTKKDAEPPSVEKPKWKKYRNVSIILLGTAVGIIVLSFIFSDWLYFLMILTVGLGLLLLLAGLILGIMAINERSKLPKKEKLKKERRLANWKIVGLVCLGFLSFGSTFIIIGLAPASGIASPVGALSILISLILAIVTLFMGLKHRRISK